MAESEEEVDVLVQRVMKDITNAFKRNPNIDEIGLIPCPEARYNRSPIVLVENKLGVESWCVKFLLPYVQSKLLLYRQRKLWLDREALVDITCTLLLLNPDFTTAWNVRKELVQCGVLNPEKDLYLGKLALTKFPKSPETWIHRRWVLQHMLQGNSPHARERKEGLRVSGEQREAVAAQVERSQRLGEQLSRTLQQEMSVCAAAAGRYPSNYNAWNHRIWVLQDMANGDVKVLHDELSSTRLWVSTHVSDHSGFHYRQFLLKTLVNEISQALVPSTNTTTTTSPQHQPTNLQSQHHPPHLQANGEALGAGEEEQQQAPGFAVPQLFHQEMELCTDLIQSYPGHETLWSHRRHVFYLWHHWKQDRQHQGCSTTNGSESTHLNHTDPGLSCHSHTGLPAADGGGSGDRGRGMNGQPHTNDAMEVDGASLPDPRDTKRLKRGPPVPNPPSLPSEHSFVAGVLDGSSSPEQKRFALLYRKWLDTVICQ